MKSIATTSLLLCASLLAPVSARQSHDRTASVHLLGPQSSGSSSSSQNSGHSGAGISNDAASTHSISSYSPSDANALMSSFLRIEEYETLRDGLEVPDQLAFPSLEDVEHQAGAASEPLMVLAEDMSPYGVNSIFPSLEEQSESPLASRLVHSFKVESTPGPKAWMELLETYRGRIAEKFGLTLKDGDSHAGKEKRMMLPPVPGSLSDDMALGPELMDETYAPYVKSLQSLAGLQDGEIDPANVPVIQLKGLKDIANKFGLKSEELRKAQEMLSITAESVIASYPGKILIVSIPVRVQGSTHKQLRSEALGSSAFSTRSNKLSYRKRDLINAAAGATSRPIVPTTGKCYESQDTCSNSTSSCFGHGQCVQGRKVGTQPAEGECWVCTCSTTKDDAGRTKYWSGEMCQKEDVSGSFFLLVGATFLLIFISAAAVALLAGVGSQPLPSTLAALGGPPGHRKHD